MTEPPKSDESDSIVTLNSLPEGSLSISQIDTLREADSIEVAAPLVINMTTDRVTHFDLVYDDTHHYLGWNPTDGQWEQILVVADAEDELIVESAVTAFADETGAGSTQLGPSENPRMEDIIEYVWEYIEYTYSDTTELYNVMDEALKEIREDNE